MLLAVVHVACAHSVMALGVPKLPSPSCKACVLWSCDALIMPHGRQNRSEIYKRLKCLPSLLVAWGLLQSEYYDCLQQNSARCSAERVSALPLCVRCLPVPRRGTPQSTRGRHAVMLCRVRQPSRCTPRAHRPHRRARSGCHRKVRGRRCRRLPPPDP